MKVAILRINLHIPAARSLKGKRQVLRSLKDRLFSRFNLSVAEVGAQDLWQRAEIGVAQVAIDAKSADAAMQKIEGFIHQHPGCAVLDVAREIIEGPG
ncbi:MAG: DUF503 domain-containing protein [Planctomycetota bacterium]